MSINNLYKYHSIKAEAATEKAINGSCRYRWRIAAALWDKAMEHTTDTSFQVKLSEAYFMGQFNRWRKNHQHLFK